LSSPLYHRSCGCSSRERLAKGETAGKAGQRGNRGKGWPKGKPRITADQLKVRVEKGAILATMVEQKQKEKKKKQILKEEKKKKIMKELKMKLEKEQEEKRKEEEKKIKINIMKCSSSS
jgi:hypothetical protein